MQRTDHPLLSPSLGSHKTLTSFHFGTPGNGAKFPKVYIQASLHAEELPGMLTAHHLRPLLEAAEAAGLLRGQVILVPVANPIGLAQRLDHKPMGRFELDTSENFNRHYPDLTAAVSAQVLPALGPDADANVHTVRAAIVKYIDAWKPTTELQSLRRTLLQLAHDADYFLDLHCDCEGVLHTDERPTVPTPRCAPTPLAGSETLRASGPGVLVFAAEPGQYMQPGDLVAEVIDPINSATQRVIAGVSGVFYARIRDRYVTAGCEIGKIAGATPFRSGNLLGA